MTPASLQRLRALREQATPGWWIAFQPAGVNWHIRNEEGAFVLEQRHGCAPVRDEANAEYICSLHNALPALLAALDRRAEQPTREGFLGRCTERQKTCAHRLYGPKQMERCIQCVIDEALEQLTGADRRAEGETCGTCQYWNLRRTDNYGTCAQNVSGPGSSPSWTKGDFYCNRYEPAPPSGGQT